jgi:hypothetical protein
MGRKESWGREKGKEEKKKNTKGLEPFLFCLGIPGALYYLIL